MGAQIIDVKIIDHSEEVLKAMKEQVEIALQAIGSEAVTYAQEDCPVDTGALRNSIAWATSKSTGSHSMPGEGGPSTPNGFPEDSAVYIGSNLEYAPAQEYGDYNHKVGKKHFLRDAAANHGDHYAEIMRAALE